MINVGRQTTQTGCLRRLFSWAGAFVAFVLLGTPAWSVEPLAIRGPSREARADARRELEQRRTGASSSTRQRSEVLSFVTEDGGLVLTNRPENYKRLNGFRRVKFPSRSSSLGRYRALSPSKTAKIGELAPIVSENCRRLGLDEALVYAIIKVESNFDASAVSHAGARGLMQLMPGTARDLGVRNSFDMRQNVRGGTTYIARMIETFGDIDLALAAYNAGPEAVSRYKGIPPYKETQNYVRLVKEWRWRIQRLGVGPALTGTATSMPLSSAPKKSGTVKLAAALPGDAAGKSTESPIGARQPCIVYFHSGLKQPADGVIDDHPYYYIEFQGQTRRIHKDRVRTVEPRT